MMGKIIIENKTDLSDTKALDMVLQVMAKGRISNDGKQYCYLTAFSIGNFGAINYMVTTFLNKNSDRFVVYKHGEQDD